MKVTQFANFANNATDQILGVTGLQRENLQSMFSYPYAIDTLNPITVMGNMIAIKNAANTSAKNVTVYIEPIQEGTGEPSPTNIRPINGRTMAQITRYGSNLADISKFVGISNVAVTFPETGSCHIVTTAQSTYRAANIRPVDMTYPPGTYYVKFKVKANPVRNSYTCVVLRTVIGNNHEGNYIQITNSNVDKSYEGIFTTTKDCYFSYIGNGNTTGDEYNTDITIYDLTVSKLDVAYEPYNREIYNISFPSEAGTVYGGILDVTNGILTVNKIMMLAKDLNFVKTTSSGVIIFYATLPNGKLVELPIGICSSYKVTNNQSAFITSDKTIRFYGSESFSRIAIHDSTYYDYTADDFTIAIGNVQFVYEIENPILYRFTPTNIITLEGNNTFYTDCDSMKLEYYRLEGSGAPND